jgi:hypothetical protein
VQACSKPIPEAFTNIQAVHPAQGLFGLVISLSDASDSGNCALLKSIFARRTQVIANSFRAPFEMRDSSYPASLLENLQYFFSIRRQLPV